MKIFKYLQSLVNKRDVLVIEEEIEPKPLKCSFCENEAIGVLVKFLNTTDRPLPIQECQRVDEYYCAEHAPEKVEE